MDGVVQGAGEGRADGVAHVPGDGHAMGWGQIWQVQGDGALIGAELDFGHGERVFIDMLGPVICAAAEAPCFDGDSGRGGGWIQRFGESQADLLRARDHVGG